MTRLVKISTINREYSLFESDNKYWIGIYDMRLATQNVSPIHRFVSGYWDTEQEGLAHLDSSEFYD